MTGCQKLLRGNRAKPSSILYKPAVMTTPKSPVSTPKIA